MLFYLILILLWVFGRGRGCGYGQERKVSEVREAREKRGGRRLVFFAFLAGKWKNNVDPINNMLACQRNEEGMHPLYSATMTPHYRIPSLPNLLEMRWCDLKSAGRWSQQEHSCHTLPVFDSEHTILLFYYQNLKSLYKWGHQRWNYFDQQLWHACSQPASWLLRIRQLNCW